jgi:hypothetical protein
MKGLKCGVTKISMLLGRKQKPFGKIERRYSMIIMDLQNS